MKKIFLLILISLISPLAFASAHVKWFVDSASITAAEHGKTPFYYLTSKEVLLWSVISLIAVLLFSFLDHKLKTWQKILDFAERKERGIIQTAQAILGVFLITVTFIWSLILSPDLPITNTLTSILGAVQVLAGLLFVFNIFPRAASMMLFGLLLFLGILASPAALLENLLLLGLALFFFIKNSPENSRFKKLDKHSVEMVRVTVGISLIVMAFTEKLMYPELSLAFLSEHNWNFMRLLGFSWYSDRLFVLSAGFAEMIFGILFILGYITRITTILIALFFATSVVIMLTQFRAWEVEDLVVYSAAILLLFFGSGLTKFFHPKELHKENYS